MSVFECTLYNKNQFDFNCRNNTHPTGDGGFQQYAKSSQSQS